MKHVYRLVGGVLAALLLVTAVGEAPAPALAAGVVYVNDTTSNDISITCPTPAFPTIQDGIDQAQSIGAKTVIVCEGDLYDAGGFVSLFPGGLTVKTLGTVIVKPTGPYGGGLFQATDSNNVNFQGFIIDGQSSLVGADAFYFYNASGSITKNTVKHWHHATPYSPTGANRGVYIHSDSKMAVKVDHNTFADMSNYGIWVESPGGVTVSHNLIQMYTTWLGGAPYKVTYEINGIYLTQTTGAKILNNTILSDRNLVNTTIPISRGILMLDSSSNQVNTNTIRNFYYGIRVGASCPNEHHASSNTFSSNTLVENKYGVAMGQWGSCSDAHYQNNKITGNKVYTWSSIFVYGIDVSPASGEDVTGNIVKGNTVGGYGAVPINVAGGNSVSGNKTPATPPPGI